MSKTVELRGQKWVVRIDSCRFYIRPAEGNPLLDREERSCLEFKHDDGPASELADLLFASLPYETVPDTADEPRGGFPIRRPGDTLKAYSQPLNTFMPVVFRTDWRVARIWSDGEKLWFIAGPADAEKPK